MEPIMEFVITIDRSETTRMECENGKVTFIPFGGSVSSKLFTGTIRPGAADVQVTNGAGIRHMCASYIFEGVDENNESCHLFVNNNGYFEPASSPKPFHACPTFMSDSKVLNDYLSAPFFRAEGHSQPYGVLIKIFDIRKEEN